MIVYASKKKSVAYLYNNSMLRCGKIYSSYCSVKIYLSFMVIFLSKCCFAANNIQIPMDLSAWVYSGTRVKCTLMHEDSSYGKFYFRALPNYQLSFELDVKNDGHHWTLASLSQRTPPWTQPTLVVPITASQVMDSGRISFRKNIVPLLRGIEKGQWLQVMLSGRHVSGPTDVGGADVGGANMDIAITGSTNADSTRTNSQTITIPLIRIQPALSQFQSCRRRLPAISFKQARDTVLHYVSGQRQLSAAQRKKLNNLISYIDVDPRITHILIDGHTDNVGSSVANLTISRTRAEQVAHILTQLGVKPGIMQIRAHGSRYPIASNHTEQGRMKNRRVTIRLVRDNEHIVPKDVVPKNIVPKDIVPKNIAPKNIVPKAMVSKTVVSKTMVPKTVVSKPPISTTAISNKRSKIEKVQ